MWVHSVYAVFLKATRAHVVLPRTPLVIALHTPLHACILHGKSFRNQTNKQKNKQTKKMKILFLFAETLHGFMAHK